ncbi:MAG: amidohydrolase family protein [Planctomycetes bacterium]|nr:amidohydrolase family protein [Planctomycetota bacterium]
MSDGRIRSVGSARDVDRALPLVWHDGVVTAGLIACRTQSGTADELQDDTRTVMGAARGVHAFEPASRDFQRALAAGITSMAIAPGPANLVGGLTCVVKTAGGRVLEPEATLALSLTGTALGRSTTQGGFSFGNAEGASALPGPAEGGPESARGTRGTRAPTSYPGALATLRELFARGEGPFGRAKRGDLLVTIDAWDRHEVLRAAQFAREQGLQGSIRGAPLAGDPDVLAALKASGLGVIVGPYSAAQTRRSLESVKGLAEAGVPVAFALDAPEHAPLELRLSAARALRSGAPREAVWKALSEDAARLVGAAESIGVLAPGHDADFVLWSGDPLDLSSRVLAVYVDGKLAWSASADD